MKPHLPPKEALLQTDLRRSGPDSGKLSGLGALALTLCVAGAACESSKKAEIEVRRQALTGECGGNEAGCYYRQQSWAGGTNDWMAGGVAVQAQQPDGDGNNVMYHPGNPWSESPRRSGYINVDAGQSYCIKARIKWTGGWQPTLQMERYGGPTGGTGHYLMGYSGWGDGFGGLSTTVEDTNEWQSLTKKVRLPEGTTSIVLVVWPAGWEKVKPESAGLGTFVDDVQVLAGSQCPDEPAVAAGTCTKSPQGACSVPYKQDFETKGGWYMEGGSMRLGEPSWTVAASGPGTPSGKAMMISADDLGSRRFSPSISVQSGKSYCFKGAARFERGTTSSVGVYWDGGNRGTSELAGNQGFMDRMGGWVAPLETVPGVWQSIVKPLKVPEGASTLMFVTGPNGPNDGNTVANLSYFDNFELTELNTPEEFAACPEVPQQVDARNKCHLAELSLTTCDLPYFEAFTTGRAAGWTTVEPHPQFFKDSGEPQGNALIGYPGYVSYGMQSPLINVEGVGTLRDVCVSTKIRWTSGTYPWMSVDLWAPNTWGRTTVPFLGPAIGPQGGGKYNVQPELGPEWKKYSRTIQLTADDDRIRLRASLAMYESWGVGGPNDALFDDFEVKPGACPEDEETKVALDCGSSGADACQLPFTQTFQDSVAAGWSQYYPTKFVTTVADPDITLHTNVVPRGGVLKFDPAGAWTSSPTIRVPASGVACVTIDMKWAAGAAPHLYAQVFNSSGALIQYNGLFGPTGMGDWVDLRVSPLARDSDGWKTYQRTITAPGSSGENPTYLALTMHFGGIAWLGYPTGSPKPNLDPSNPGSQTWVDDLKVTDGPCNPPGTGAAGEVVFAEDWEGNVRQGWSSSAYDEPGAVAPPVEGDETSPAGPTALTLRRSVAAGGDYVGPKLNLAAGEYCAIAQIRWDGGGQPFLGYKIFGADGRGVVGDRWLIGSEGYNDGTSGPVEPVWSDDSGWNEYRKTFTVAEGGNVIALQLQAWNNVVKPGTTNAQTSVAFDGIKVTKGACALLEASSTRPCGRSLGGACEAPVSSTFEDDVVGGFRANDGQLPTLVADPNPGEGNGGSRGSGVWRMEREAEGGDFAGPFVKVNGGQHYCFSADIKWERGAIPFLWVNRHDTAGVQVATHFLFGPPGNQDGLGGWLNPVVREGSRWHRYTKTLRMPAGSGSVRWVTELKPDVRKDGDSISYLDNIEIKPGYCEQPDGAVLFSETWDEAVKGWTDVGGQPVALTSEAAAPLMGNAQKVARSRDDGDYVSPAFPISGGQICVSSSIQWLGGGAPFVMPLYYDAAGRRLLFAYAIGAADSHANITAVDPTVSEWKVYRNTMMVPAEAVSMSLVTALSPDGGKGGDAEAYFDDLSVTKGACASTPLVPRRGRIEAESFDAAHTIRTDQVEGTVSAESSNAWLQFNGVDFGVPGQFGAIEMLILGSSGDRKLQVYLDSIDGILAAELFTLPSGNSDLSARPQSVDLKVSVFGIHRVFVKLSDPELGRIDWTALKASAGGGFRAFPAGFQHDYPDQRLQLTGLAVASEPPEDVVDAVALVSRSPIILQPGGQRSIPFRSSAPMRVLGKVEWQGPSDALTLEIIDEMGSKLAQAQVVKWPTGGVATAMTAFLPARQFAFLLKNTSGSSITFTFTASGVLANEGRSNE